MARVLRETEIRQVRRHLDDGLLPCQCDPEHRCTYHALLDTVHALQVDVEERSSNAFIACLIWCLIGLIGGATLTILAGWLA